MNIQGSTILLTGACGGIGRAVAYELARRGAYLVLVGRRTVVLEALAAELREVGACQVFPICADLSAPDAASALARQALALAGRLDGLIHCAGIQSFSAFVDESEAATDAVFALNTLVPMRLARAVLPHLLRQRSGRIVLVGSIFGSIGFPFFVSYSASKFALRGFAEALRRELAGSGVGIAYVAPRFTRTPFNRSAVVRMAEAMRMNQDEPEAVAARIIAAFERGGSNQYLGWPEKIFVRINSLLPQLVDRPLMRQVDRMRPFAAERTR
jgi:short-subunit dehydrogenase